MGQLLISNVDDEIIAALKLRAELHGVSLEQEPRDIIRTAVPTTPEERLEMSRRLRLDSSQWSSMHRPQSAGADDEFLDAAAKASEGK